MCNHIGFEYTVRFGFSVFVWNANLHAHQFFLGQTGISWFRIKISFYCNTRTQGNLHEDRVCQGWSKWTWVCTKPWPQPHWTLTALQASTDTFVQMYTNPLSHAQKYASRIYGKKQELICVIGFKVYSACKVLAIYLFSELVSVQPFDHNRHPILQKNNNNSGDTIDTPDPVPSPFEHVPSICTHGLALVTLC